MVFLKKKKERVLACVFILVLAASLVLSGITVFNRYVRKEKSLRDVDFAKEYAFESDLPAPIKKSIPERIEAIISTVGAIPSTSNVGYYQIVSQKKFLDRNLYHYNLTTSISGTSNQKYDTQDVVVMHENGYLSFITDQKDVAAPINRVNEFSNYLTGIGIENQLLFIPTAKNGEIDASYQGVFADQYDEITQAVKEGVSASNFDIISFDDWLKDHDLAEEEMFFRTDHHWLPTTGLIGCGLISDWLNTKGIQADSDMYNVGKYRIEYSDVPFLGSQGKKATASYVEPEKMMLLLPDYETDLSVYLSMGDKTLEGNIEETLLNYSYVENPDLYKSSHYAFYGHGSMSLVQIHNRERHDGSRILVIKESFANCMYPYMCHMAEYVDVLDLRHFKGSLKSYIAKNRPDAVIVIYGTAGFAGYNGYYQGTTDPFGFE